ncbi:MAG TPA: glycosyltransferase, partial [Chitinophagales bacterium]|nr:glycosyltransferase [Chitinophagales bacterium]
MARALVIIPTYNEQANIADMITAVLSLPQDFDLLIIDDNSPDGTASAVTAMQSTYPT